MTIKHVTCAVLIVGALLAIVVPAQAAYAQNGGMTGVVSARNPHKPVLSLKNTTGQACQVIATSLGTVAITSAVQDGKTITPILLETAFDESLEITLANKFRTLQPGESIDIPLRVFPFESGRTLEAVTWSPGAGSVGMAYKLQPSKPLDIELTYASPLQPQKGAALCPMVFATTDTTSHTLTLLIPIALAIVVAAGIIIFVLHKKRRAATVAALFVCGTALTLWPAPAAKAIFEVPDDIAGPWATCMATLNAHPDITGPILDLLNRPDLRVEIVPTNDGTNDYAQYGKHHHRIYWDPNARYPYFGTGGNADPCTSLFHEMFHAFDTEQGTFSRAPCGSSPIETKEVMATRAQNQLRERLGMPPRSHYGRDPLPSGDCRTPPPPEQCPSGSCANSNGDPHLRTFDGMRYDFQAVGEFIAARDTKGPYQVQVRQQAWPGSRQVAVNTAVAIKTGSDTVELAVENQVMTLYINGEKRELKNTTLPSGNRILVTPRTITVNGADKSVTTIRPIGSWGFHVVLDAPPASMGNLEGLFGDGDSDSRNDIRLKNNEEPIKPEFSALYPAFADSWRISQDESLFTYGEGKDASTYTDKSFPESDVDTSQLPNRAIAEALCRRMGVTDANVLQDCIVDVALTGRAEFAHAAANGQFITAGADYGGTVWPIEIKNPGDIARVAFDAKAGQKVFLDVFATTLQNQCGILQLHRPDGQLMANGCIINGRGMIDGTVLPLDGQYTITVDPYNDVTGVARLRLITIKDHKKSIIADTNGEKVTINKPGEVTELTFNGVSGQRVFVHVRNALLDHHCGGLQLRRPDNQLLATGCIINGVGYIDRTVLPADGQYKIVLDPAERTTGSATVQLITPRHHEQRITIGGQATTITLDRPGSMAVLTFAGNAGSKVTIDMTTTGLTGQCAPLVLRVPGGSRLKSGCIINNEGDLGSVELPATGDYTLAIDPIEATTGNITVRVRQ